MAVQEHKYTNNIHHKRVLLVGVFPPPLGGISVHLKRVWAKLERQGCVVSAWDVAQQPKCGKIVYYGRLWQFCLQNRPQVIIYHTMQLRRYPIELFTLLLAGCWLGSQKIVMIHSARFIYLLNRFSLWLTGWILGYFDQLILVSEAQKQEIGSRIDLTHILQISTESPFLLPGLGEKELILGQMPADLRNFMQNHEILVSCIITRKIVWQGQDLYGLDLALAAFASFKQVYPTAGLILVIGDRVGYEKLKPQHGVYLLWEWPHEIWPIIGKADLLIRPTRSDSFGISIMEALSLGVPVVASDVCERPAETILFKSGDMQDLYAKMIGVMQDGILKPAWARQAHHERAKYLFNNQIKPK